MTDIGNKFKAATLTLQKQGRFNRKPDEVLNVVAKLQQYGLTFGGNDNQ